MTPRSKFLALVGIFLVPTLASFMAFYFFPPSKTTNYGTLISPVVALPQTTLVRLDTDTPVLDPALRGKWLIVTRDSGVCDGACEQKLFAMRQSRLIVGREMDRIVRVVLIDDDTAPSAEIIKRYQGTAWVSAKASPWLAKVPVPPQDASNGRAFFYAVDPLGNIFMRYGTDADTKLIAKDLRRVLKASQIG